ncbi:fucose mutarotase isoform X3 [Pteronotus mesoamericanus]|uniref:fucose mutarotase isoform X3 n=1 Tax=Pteronotus mesoamericanus TaxID=1884717 RepID=UPI0023ED35F6|nr:fucose mutarotase isoform X3 [Pteronotus parnellii mesoamericanus]
MVVLKGVPALLSPELLYALARMGHGDAIVLADVNFPTSSICKCGPEEIRADGLDIPQLLEAVLKLLPLDTYVESPAAVMELVSSDMERGLQTPVWKSYQSILLEAGCSGDGPLRKPHPQEGGAGPRRPAVGWRGIRTPEPSTSSRPCPAW